jgi:CBS domain-containing protein
MESHVKVSDVMTFGVASVSPQTPVADAAQTLLDHRISGLPVVDAQRRLVGIITEGDIVRSIRDRGNAEDLASVLSSMRVDQAMTEAVRAIDGDAPVEEAIEMIRQSGLRAVPVTSAGQVVGMFSRPDMIRYLLEAKH